MHLLTLPSISPIPHLPALTRVANLVIWLLIRQHSIRLATYPLHVDVLRLHGEIDQTFFFLAREDTTSYFILFSIKHFIIESLKLVIVEEDLAQCFIQEQRQLVQINIRAYSTVLPTITNESCEWLSLHYIVSLSSLLLGSESDLDVRSDELSKGEQRDLWSWNPQKKFFCI